MVSSTKASEAAVKAVARWRELNEEHSVRQIGSDNQREVFVDLPRRTPIQFDPSLMPVTGAPMRQTVARRASIWRAGLRLLRWVAVLARFATGTVFDRLRGKDQPSRRAQRLRVALESLGGTFLKLGQQLSIRVDLLPEIYCHEFGRLLDQVSPFPTAKAIEIVEDSLGQPIPEVFAQFDPEPIGSASMACVFQARLLSGERVAVKVRRPGITHTFAADWRALGWLARIAELSTFVRKGQISTVLRDLRAMIDEELDFQLEARNTELFQRCAKQAKLKGVSTPKVYFEHSSQKVLVTEFVSGVWLWEILAAKEQQNPEAITLLRDLDISAEEVARRLYRASLFGIFDSYIFHADPHPANVVIRANGEVVLVDFGSCGSFSNHQVRLMRQFHANKVQGDLGGMVKCILSLLEPLPPIDVDTLTQRITEVLLKSLRAVDSPNAAWWERTSAGVWLSFMTVVRAFDIRVDLDILRMIRSTLLYDTIALRLDPELDIYSEYQSYRSAVAKRSRKRLRKGLGRLARGDVDDRWFLRLEEGTQTMQRAFYHLERALDSPTYRFMFLAGKTVFALGVMANWIGLSLFTAIAATGVLSVWRSLSGAPERASLIQGFAEVLRHGAFQSFAVLALMLSLRQVLIRLRDPEI